MKLTPEQIEEAVEMRRAGESATAIARHFGVDDGTVRRAVDAEWAANRREQINRARRARQREERGAKGSRLASNGKPAVMFVDDRQRPTEEEYRQALRLIPPDTRDLTGKLMDDPLPGDTRRRFVARERA